MGDYDTADESFGVLSTISERTEDAALDDFSDGDTSSMLSDVVAKLEHLELTKTDDYLQREDLAEVYTKHIPISFDGDETDDDVVMVTGVSDSEVATTSDDSLVSTERDDVADDFDVIASQFGILTEDDVQEKQSVPVKHRKNAKKKKR